MPDFDGHDAILMIAASETSPDLYYASGFLAPDDFVYFETPRQKVLLMSDLEIDRARAESRADLVLSISKHEEAAKKAGVENPTALDALDVALREHGIRSLLVPRKFPIEAADFLRGKGFHLSFKKGSILPERETKAKVEKSQEIKKLPTWPWETGTLRNFITALLIPLTAWGIQQVLLRTVVR
jgi:Xaa-Pro aminopeptidase